MKQLTLRRRRFMSVFLSFAVTAATMSGSWLIPASASEEGSGGNAAKIGENEYPTLQEAITAADDNAEITLLRDVSENVSSENKSYTLDMQGFTLTPGDDANTIYTINGGTVVINGNEETRATITGANATVNGGAISASGGADVTLNNINVTENKAYESGGGIYLDGSTLTMENTAVDKNATTDRFTELYCGGGGIAAVKDSTVTIKAGCSVSENTLGSATNGTALYIDESTLETENTTDNYIEINNNKSHSDGGNRESALCAENSTINLNKVQISGNENTKGVAAVAVRTSEFSATDCEFKDNISTNDSTFYFLIKDNTKK